MTERRAAGSELVCRSVCPRALVSETGDWAAQQKRNRPFWTPKSVCVRMGRPTGDAGRPQRPLRGRPGPKAPASQRGAGARAGKGIRVAVRVALCVPVRLRCSLLDTRVRMPVSQMAAAVRKGAIWRPKGAIWRPKGAFPTPSGPRPSRRPPPPPSQRRRREGRRRRRHRRRRRRRHLGPATRGLRLQAQHRRLGYPTGTRTDIRVSV